jgi:hypothetical protein
MDALQNTKMDIAAKARAYLGEPIGGLDRIG